MFGFGGDFCRSSSPALLLQTHQVLLAQVNVLKVTRLENGVCGTQPGELLDSQGS